MPRLGQSEDERRPTFYPIQRGNNVAIIIMVALAFLILRNTLLHVRFFR